MKYNKELKDYIKPMLMTHGDIKKFTKGIPITSEPDDDLQSLSSVG